jgi:hypothetical protein
MAEVQLYPDDLDPRTGRAELYTDDVKDKLHFRN